jgi:hypothetical protein
MRKTIPSLLIATLLSVLTGTPAAGSPGGPGEVVAPAAQSQAFGQAETIRGSLMIFIKEQRLIVLKAEGGVPYNFRVTQSRTFR